MLSASLPTRLFAPDWRAALALGPEVVFVGPGSSWGNPYRLDDNHQPWSAFPWMSPARRVAWIEHYRRSAEAGFVTVPYTRVELPDGRYSFGAHRPREVAAGRRGKTLACTCPAGEPCHGDLLLAWANPDLFPAALEPADHGV